MATSSDGYLDSASNAEVEQHLRRVALPDLFDNQELVKLASEAEVPANQGLLMIIPSFTNENEITSPAQAKHGAQSTPIRGDEFLPISGGTTATVANLRDVEHSSVTATLKYYAEGYRFSKVFARSVSIEGNMERASKYLMQGVALNQERLLQNQILYGAPGTEATDVSATDGVLHTKNNTAPGYVSATEPMYASPTGANTAWDDLTSTDSAVAEGFAQARRLLRKRRAPGFSQLGGTHAAYVGPATCQSLLTQTNSSEASLTFEQESMNMTSSFRNNVIGRLFGFTVFESTLVREIDDDDATYGTNAAGSTTAAGSTFEYNILFGPDAFFVCPHEAVNPGVIVKGFNEGGAFNPTNSVMSVSVDYLFAAKASGQIGERCVIMPSSTSF